MKKKYFDLGGNRTHDLRIRSTVTLPTELRGRTEKVGDDLGGELRRRESKDQLLKAGPLNKFVAYDFLKFVIHFHHHLQWHQVRQILHFAGRA